jgi:hypothetical protein
MHAETFILFYIGKENKQSIEAKDVEIIGTAPFYCLQTLKQRVSSI